MHLDQRIHNKEFIIRIIAHMATGNYYILCTNSSVADPGCLSRILIFFPSRISYPGNNNKKEEKAKKLGVFPFFVALNFTKL
jgi:hypothetical protein